MAPAKKYDAIVAGGGPAGASAAIHLASRGARVLLAEQKKFPRAKLCGEFISPECRDLFQRLGVGDQMVDAQPALLKETAFYSRTGGCARVPSEWFGSTGIAMGLSRAEMDERLLRRASEVGADVLENAQVTGLIFEGRTVCGITLKQTGSNHEFGARITIDATGRSRALTRHLKANARKRRRPTLVALKAHLENTRVQPETCEIYFYHGGYGGLSSIENGLSNLCFIASARDVRACRADPDRVMREVVLRNRRARETLTSAIPASPWLAVSLEKFGRQPVAPADGMLAIGDAAAFIDPFTGSGMLMALQSGELAAATIDSWVNSAGPQSLSELRLRYREAYGRTFDSRLRVCSLIRRAAFIPGLAQTAVTLCAASDRLRRRLARATRGGARRRYSPS